jgi:hypothetical protein
MFDKRRSIGRRSSLQPTIVTDAHEVDQRHRQAMLAMLLMVEGPVVLGSHKAVTKPNTRRSIPATRSQRLAEGMSPHD